MIAYNLTTPPPVAAMFLRAPLAMPSPREMIEAETHRLIDVLDDLDGDDDLEADQNEYRRMPDGTFATVGFSSDDEASLCGVGSHERLGNCPSILPAYDYGGDPIDVEGDDAEHELTLGWADNERQVGLGPNTEDGDVTAPERFGAGFIRCGVDDAEDAGDDEPSLGSFNPRLGVIGFEVNGVFRAFDGASQLCWSQGGTDDREDCDDNGIADDDGVAEQFARARFAAGGVL